MLVRSCSVQSEEWQVTTEHGIRASTCMGDTAEASHPTQHHSSDITLLIHLAGESGGLTEHLLIFSWDTGVIIWVRGGFRTLTELFRDRACAKTAKTIA